VSICSLRRSRLRRFNRASRARAREGIDHFGVTVDDIDAAFAHLTCCEAQIVEPVRQIRLGALASCARRAKCSSRCWSAPRRDDFSLESQKDGTMSTARAALPASLIASLPHRFHYVAPCFHMRNWITCRSRPPARRASANRLRLREPRQYRRDARSARSAQSLYRADDVARLCRKKQVGRKREALAAGTIFGAEPCIYSGITTFAKGHPYYRGRDTIALAQLATLEDVATLLWNARARLVPLRRRRPGATGRNARSPMRVHVARRARGQRPFHARAHGRGPACRSRSTGRDRRAGSRCGDTREGGADTPIHARLAQGWGQDASGAELIRKAMVLVADHEITSSAFAARITASTGASLPGCLLTVSRPFRGRCTATPPGACAPSSTT
jgi:hypothetical protein